MKKNVMFLIGNLTNGGSERSIINVANEISKFHNVILVCCNKEKQDFECKVKIIEIPELRFRKHMLTGIKKLRKIKKEYNIDVTISYITVYNFFNCISKRKDTTIISIRNYLSKKERGIRFHLMNRLSALLCNKMVCCCENVKQDQIKKYHAYKKKISVIENFCNESLIEEQMKESIPKKYTSDNLIVSISRLETHKGNEHTIKAISLLTKKNKSIKLLLFGREKENSNELKYLKELVKEYKLEDYVFFMGFDSNPFKYLKHAKAFVLASDYEGFPNVIMEAMKCGVPVIATDSYGGVEEILANKVDYQHITNSIRKEEYGIMVPNFIEEHRQEKINDKEIILSKAMQMFLNNKELYNHYHKKSLERIQCYEKEKIIKKWLEVIS